MALVHASHSATSISVSDCVARAFSTRHLPKPAAAFWYDSNVAGSTDSALKKVKFPRLCRVWGRPFSTPEALPSASVAALARVEFLVFKLRSHAVHLPCDDGRRAARRRPRLVEFQWAPPCFPPTQHFKAHHAAQVYLVVCPSMTRHAPTRRGPPTVCHLRSTDTHDVSTPEGEMSTKPRISQITESFEQIPDCTNVFGVHASRSFSARSARL